MKFLWIFRSKIMKIMDLLTFMYTTTRTLSSLRFDVAFTTALGQNGVFEETPRLVRPKPCSVFSAAKQLRDVSKLDRELFRPVWKKDTSFDRNLLFTNSCCNPEVSQKS